SPVVPRPDMNSGDLRLCSLIGIMAQEYEITLVSCVDKPGDDAYISLLKQAGVAVYSARFSLWKLLKAEKFKVALLEFYFTAGFYLDRIRILQPECRVVVDTVDVHYLRLKQKYDLTKDEGDYATYLETKEKELRIYRKSDAVITVTKDDAAALFEESLDIPSEVVHNVHEICLSDATPEKDSLIFVGGFSHDPNVDAVLYFCSDILPIIRKNKPDIHITIVGSNPPDEIRMLKNEFITVTGYVPETTTYLHRSHISVAPLRYGAGMKGKIGEAMAHGVPVVTTSVGAEGMGLTDRKNVMIADSPQDFADAVLDLLNDSCLYGAIRNNAIQIVNDNYTSQRVAKTMITALERIRKNPVKRTMLHEKILFISSYLTQKIKARLCAS
ncbi:MAG: glycosyltransferase, partial [Desulfuromonadaceae bacterium]|nr:glycosyltransferase [Desulfuromonadaceae bacterium]